MRKIAVLVASRANFGRLKSVLRHIDAHPDLELQLIVAASALLPKYGCLDAIEREFRVDERLWCVLQGDTTANMARTTGVLTVQMAQALERLAPDALLVHADRYEMLAAATAAAYMNIPVVHTEGGEHTGSIDEKVRWAITALADWHLPVTERAKAELLARGVQEARCRVVGSPALDMLRDLPARNPLGLEPRSYVLVVLHPVTTEYGNAAQMAEAVADGVARVGLPVVWVAPNVDAGRAAIEAGQRVVDTMAPEDFGALLRDAAVLVGNTSAGIKEGAFLGVPYVCVGTRQRSRDSADNVLRVERVHAETVKIATRASMWSERPASSHCFGDGHSGQRIANFLAEVDLVHAGHRARARREQDAAAQERAAPLR